MTDLVQCPDTGRITGVKCVAHNTYALLPLLFLVSVCLHLNTSHAHGSGRLTTPTPIPHTHSCFKRIVQFRCGEEVFEADAVISAVGINGAKSIVRASPTLNRRKMFQDMMNLRCVRAGVFVERRGEETRRREGKEARDVASPCP